MSTEVVVASGGLDCHLMSGCGFPAPGAEIFQFDAVFTFTIGTLEFHITKITLLLLLCVILILAFFSYAFRKPKLVPRGAQNVGEMGYLFIPRRHRPRGDGQGEGDKFVPFLFSFFFLVWLSNFMGIIALAQIPVTSIFAIPVAFALIVYVTWVPIGICKQGFFGFFKNMMFPPPAFEGHVRAARAAGVHVEHHRHAAAPRHPSFRQHVRRPSADRLVQRGGLLPDQRQRRRDHRLCASFVVAIALTGFEVLIQALQAYIFTLLAAVYIGGALHAEH